MALINEQLMEIRKRAEAATIGDWDYDVEDGGISNGNFMVAMGDLGAEGYPVIKAKEADLEFIAHSREDVPKLLAEIERLKEENNTLRGNIATIRKLTKCDDTKDFAKRALIGEATIRI